MEFYNKHLIKQTKPEKLKTGYDCNHCKWICRRGKMPGEYYGQINIDKQMGDGVSVYLSGNRYEYSFELVRNIHKTDNNIDILIKAADTFIHHLNTLGIHAVHVALSHHWDKKIESKEHQHIWVIIDKRYHNLYDEIFAMKHGYALYDVKDRKIRDIKPYKSDKIYNLKCLTGNELMKLVQNPLSYIGIQNMNKSFYLFIEYNYCICQEMLLSVSRN